MSAMGLICQISVVTGLGYKHFVKHVHAANNKTQKELNIMSHNMFYI